jgi:hypothetical protein
LDLHYSYCYLRWCAFTGQCQNSGRDPRGGLAGGPIPVYQLTVTGSRQTPGRISDVIYLETDSKIRPTLNVPVFGTIIEAKKEPS